MLIITPFRKHIHEVLQNV